jgi:flavin reductase (DIM6/NTAB) family NADH-FMN oxidoreductase RutF
MKYPSQAAAANFSSTDFRAALSMFATGVTVITTRAADGRQVGLTASSFNSVSLTPPLVLWSLARTASAMTTFESCTQYAVNVLAADQTTLALRFASKAADRFAGVAWREGQGGAPVLEGAAAVFECFNRHRYEGGDHLIFIGEVERCSQRADAQPLIYQGGAFFNVLSRTE